jgi:hypothetical protein
MNPATLKALCRAARAVPAHQTPEPFAQRVCLAILREPQREALFDQLAALFPRLAGVATLVAMLAVGADWWWSDGALTDLVAEAAMTQPDGWFEPLAP